MINISSYASNWIEIDVQSQKDMFDKMLIK